MKRKKTFRVGQRVRSIYEPEKIFRIDKSMQPERIFHARGSDRWFTKSELLALGVPENPTASIRLNGKGRMRGTHPDASPAIPDGPQVVAEPSAGLEERKCLECDVKFRPTRRWQKFHSETCRRSRWKRNTSIM